MKESKSYCRYCGRPIKWVCSPLGRWVPVEPRICNLLPTDSGPIIGVNEKGETIKGMIKKRASEKTIKVSLPHRSYCRVSMESGNKKAATSG